MSNLSKAKWRRVDYDFSECEIELENGKIHKFSPEEYIALAEASLNHVIDGIKKGEENRQGRRGGLAS